jgi:hypothetical protein
VLWARDKLDRIAFVTPIDEILDSLQTITGRKYSVAKVKKGDRDEIVYSASAKPVEIVVATDKHGNQTVLDDVLLF